MKIKTVSRIKKNISSISVNNRSNNSDILAFFFLNRKFESTESKYNNKHPNKKNFNFQGCFEL